MRKMKALSLLLAAALTVSSVAVNDTTADAAKKPKLSKSKVSITVGKKYKIKLKNGAKKAKVTWKTSKKSVVKIVKKNTKGKTAFAQVKGVKKGKAVITASYKLGKSKAKSLKCTVTVKKAALVNITNAPVTSAPAGATNAPATLAPANPSNTPDSSKSPEDTKAPDKTTKPTKTPKPTATVKPSAEPNPDLNPDVIDVMELAYLDVAEDKGIKATNNDDGSVTIDYTGTTYAGVRWYFGTAAADEDSEPVQKPLNLENYSYVVVEGINQAGVTADEEGKVHDLNAQLLDSLDHAEHGGLLEIDTQANVGFPLKFELTDKTKRTNVAAFEIYSLGNAESTKAGPITVKSIKIYKDKATYDKIMAEGEATPEPTATATPEPTATAEPTAKPTPITLDLSTATKIGGSGTINYDTESKVLELSDAEGALIKIGKQFPLGTKLNVTINGESTDGFRAWLSQGEQNASAIVNPVELGQTYEFVVEDFQAKGSTFADTVQIKGLYYGAKIGSLKITSIVVEEVLPTPEPVDIEPVETQITVNNNNDVVLGSDIIPATRPEWFFVDPATNVVDNGTISFKLVTAMNPANSLFFNGDKSGVELSDYQKVVMVLSSDVAGAKLRAHVSKSDTVKFDNQESTGTMTRIETTGEEQVVEFDLSKAAGEVGYGISIQNIGWENSKDVTLTIKSITLVGETVVNADKYAIPENASKVYIKGAASGIDVDEELDVVNYADLGDYVATYKNAFDSFTKMADKTSGTIEKPIGDKDVVYTASAANKGTITYNDKSTDVEFVKAEGSITAKFERQGHAFEATAVEGEDGVISITKDGVEGYTAKVSGDSSAFTVEYTTASGKLLHLVYDGTSMSIITTADISVAVDAN